MNPLDDVKRLHEEVFKKGQELIAQEKAAQDLTEYQGVIQQAAMAAAETIDVVNKLAADNDPHKVQLAALIKQTVVGAWQEAASRPSAAEDGRVIESRPFSVSSPSLRTSLPDTPEPLPPTPKPLPPPQKRRRGRPRKHPPQEG